MYQIPIGCVTLFLIMSIISASPSPNKTENANKQQSNNVSNYSIDAHEAYKTLHPKPESLDWKPKKVTQYQSTSMLQEIKNSTRPNYPIVGSGAVVVPPVPASNIAKKGPRVNETMIAAASLLRPSFIRALLGGQKSLSAGQQPEEETEEEITQTIMVPADSSQVEKESHIMQQISGQKSRTRPSESEQHVAAQDRPKWQKPPHKEAQLLHHHQASAKFQPKAEASLQLTSTEMSSLLNDREAPEFYRERELNGDGVLVAEEPRLGMAASGHFGSAGYGGQSNDMSMHSFNPEPIGNFGGAAGADPALFAHHQNRLSQAATEDGPGGNFNHRFGQMFGGEDMGAFGGQFQPDRLMQSPNEYSEASSHSGLGGTGIQFDSTAAFGAAGYPNSPMLDRHASEIYGGTPGSLGPSGGLGPSELGPMNGQFYGPTDGRLGQAASHNPYSQNDDYVARFGQQQPMGLQFDQREFGGSGLMMPQQSRSFHQELSGQASGLGAGEMSTGNRLMPLSPIVPVGEDLFSHRGVNGIERETGTQIDSLNGEQQLASLNAQQRYVQGQQAQSQPIVHEAIEDSADVSQADEQSSSSDGQQQHTPSDSIDNDSYATTTMSSSQESSGSSSESSRDKSLPSLVLNVPPPSDQTSDSNMAQMVEFSRIGSAGYLGPLAQGISNRQQISKKPSLQSSHQQDRDPSDNPAHAGKYIID